MAVVPEEENKLSVLESAMCVANKLLKFYLTKLIIDENADYVRKL